MRLHSYPLAEIVSHIRVMVYPESKPLVEAYVKQSQIHNHYTYKYNHFTYKIMCGARIITHIKSKKKRGDWPVPISPRGASVRQCASHAQRHDPDSHAASAAALCSACAASAMSASICRMSTPHDEHHGLYMVAISALSVIGAMLISQSCRIQNGSPHGRHTVRP
jgi:hypothetical protein